MKKKLLFYLTFMCSLFAYSQVGINTAEPNANTLLHVSERTDPNNSSAEALIKGIIIPRLTESERDKLTYENPTANPKVLRLLSSDNSLMIYNTTEDCYNYWNYLEKEWKSICGRMGKAVFTFDCTKVQVSGSYTEGKELTTSNYLSIPVNVTKIGEYTITAKSGNGYSFTASGTFLTTGEHTVTVTGQGKPLKVQTDNLSLNVNGTDSSCSPSVNVLSAAGTYTLSCGSSTVNGIYKVGVALTSSNTITLPVTVSSLGSYSITSNTVNGISFSGSGTFTSTGSQTVTLTGTGTPTTTSPTTITITSNSQGEVATSCNVQVIIVIPIKTILHIGSETVYGYSAYTGASRQLIDSSTNFGTSTSSTVKSEGFTHISLGVSPSNANLLAALNNNPDIVIIGFDNSSLNATQSGYLLDYLNKKGVVIALQDRTDANVSANFLRLVLSNPALSISYGSGAGSVYPITNANNVITNGPFGDLRGKYWGEDASTTVNVPSGLSNITPISYGQAVNSTSTKDGITSFMHNHLNLVWFGDGGFLSNSNANGNPTTNNTLTPFAAPSSGGYKPIGKAYGSAGNGYTAGSMQVQNSILFANIMAWAMNKAEHDGINTK